MTILSKLLDQLQERVDLRGLGRSLRKDEAGMTAETPKAGELSEDL